MIKISIITNTNYFLIISNHCNLKTENEQRVFKCNWNQINLKITCILLVQKVESQKKVKARCHHRTTKQSEAPKQRSKPTQTYRLSKI